MNRNSWTSPFGLAFLVGSLAALVAGFFTGAGMRGGSELNMASPMLNNMAEPYVDENALVAANREPAAPEAPPPAPVQAAPAPEPQPAINDSAPVTRRSPAAEPDADVDLLPPEPREPPRRRRSAEPPPEEDPGDEPPGY